MHNFYFKYGSHNVVIFQLKQFLNTRHYIGIKNNTSQVFDDTFKSSLVAFQRHHRLTVNDGSLNLETYHQLGLEMYRNQIEMISVHSPNIKTLLNSNSNVNVLDTKALLFLQKTLPKSIRKHIILDEHQFIDIKKFKKINSKDANFLALETLVNAKDITEIATAKEGMYGENNPQKFFLITFSTLRENEIQEAIKTRSISRQQAEKEIQLYGPAAELTGYLGQTYGPNGEDGSPKSPSGNLRAVATDQTGEGITEQDAVTTMGHEVFGHAYNFRIGNKTWTGEGPVMTAIEERTKKNYLEQ